jgi:hypothetical protein
MSASVVSGKDESLARITRIATMAEWASVSGILVLVGGGVYQLLDFSRAICQSILAALRTRRWSSPAPPHSFRRSFTYWLSGRP